MSETIKLEIISKCIKDFGGKDKFKNVFNTASYQRNIMKFFNLTNLLSSHITRNHLENDKNILELSGGCHWILNRNS